MFVYPSIVKTSSVCNYVLDTLAGTDQQSCIEGIIIDASVKSLHLSFYGSCGYSLKSLEVFSAAQILLIVQRTTIRHSVFSFSPFSIFVHSLIICFFCSFLCSFLLSILSILLFFSTLFFYPALFSPSLFIHFIF